MPRPRPSRSGADEPLHVLEERLLREDGRQLGERLARRQRERGERRAPRSAVGRRSTRSGESVAVHWPFSTFDRLVALEAEVRVLAVVRQLAAEARAARAGPSAKIQPTAFSTFAGCRRTITTVWPASGIDSPSTASFVPSSA